MKTSIRFILPFSILIALLLFPSAFLAQEPAEILWDDWGIPHIYADNEADLFFAQGWAQMHLHGNLILELYGRSRGKAAEYWGEDHLQGDMLLHTLGLPQLAEKWTDTQFPAVQKRFESFVEGMNAYARTYPEIFEPENRVVLPLQASDINCHYLYVVYSNFVGGSEMGLVQQWEEQGSNTLAIGPSRSASGNALLLQNPHLPWSGEFTWMEVHLVSPGHNRYGSHLVGFPGIAIGFNENLGWSHTDNTLDNADTYELELTGDGYVLDGVSMPFEQETQTLLVRDDEGGHIEREWVVLRSRHGPVVKMGETKALAIRMPGYDRPNAAAQWWNALNARNLEEFEAAMRMGQIPFWNVMYADKAGNIFYLFNGQIPNRSHGDWAYWNQVIPGHKSANIWTSVHPYEDLPKLKNPESGWLQNTNDPPWSSTFPMVLDPADYPPYFAPEQIDFRNQRSIKMISEDESISFDELVAYKHSTRIELADRILDDLFEAIDNYGSEVAREGKAILENWDRQAETQSVGTKLFIDWAINLGLFSWRQEKFVIPWSPEAPLTTPDGLADPQEAVRVFEKFVLQGKEWHGSLDHPYGELLRLKRNGHDLPGNGAQGNLGAFRVISTPGGEPENFFVRAGDSYVGVIEFGDRVRAKVLLSYGNSSQEDSPHNGDQLQLFSEKKMRDALFYREDVLEHVVRKEVLSGNRFVAGN